MSIKGKRSDDDEGSIIDTDLFFLPLRNADEVVVFVVAALLFKLLLLLLSSSSSRLVSALQLLSSSTTLLLLLYPCINPVRTVLPCPLLLKHFRTQEHNPSNVANA